MPAYTSRLLIISILLAFGSLRTSALADEQQELNLSAEALRQYGRADRALRDLDGFLKAIGFENPAIIGVNYFALSVGGIDAIRDLEEGRGVDPETFAGLLAGFARPEVARHLNLQKLATASGEVTLKIDAPDGRLRYKGTVVRLYSPTRLAELFDRRETFQVENVRKRLVAFGNFVSARQGKLGAADRQADKSEVSELSQRYQQLQPILADLLQAVEAETGAVSIIQGGSMNYFGMSVGGINALEDLTQQNVVDPETLGAIYAQRVSSDHADAFQYSRDGQILYDGNEIKLYSVNRLTKCFKDRDRLSQQAN